MQTIVDIFEGTADLARIVLEYDDGAVLTQIVTKEGISVVETTLNGSLGKHTCTACDNICLSDCYDPRFHVCNPCWKKQMLNTYNPPSLTNVDQYRNYYNCIICDRPHKTLTTLHYDFTCIDKTKCTANVCMICGVTQSEPCLHYYVTGQAWAEFCCTACHYEDRYKAGGVAFI
jgi:hypothetical protein